MTAQDHKAVLHRYLQTGRDALVWKLDGLSEYDVRRPMVPTGTNLLGLVKHLAGVEFGYFGETFGRPIEDPPAWLADEAYEADPTVDMWASADESREQILALYDRARAHTDGTVDALDLDAPGSVAWWPPERRDVTLQQILVHVTTETHRHAGHADLVRELIDGTVGLRRDNDNMPPDGSLSWEDYRNRLEAVAREAGRR